MRAQFLGAVTAVVMGVTGCSDRRTVAGLSRPVVEGVAAGPQGGFPIVIVSPHGAHADAAGAPVVDNFADALSRVAPGGTIRVMGGLYDVVGVVVDKPVLIEALPHAQPLLRASSGFASFTISGVPSGTVTFRRLHFANLAAVASIAAVESYDQVVVDSCDFVTTQNGASVYGSGSATAATQVVVRGSSFAGGSFGVFLTGIIESGVIVENGPRFDIAGNRFAGDSEAAIEVRIGATGRVSGNAIDRCGFDGCVRVTGDRRVEVVGNQLTSDLSSKASLGIFAASGVGLNADVLIDSNEVLGTGGSGMNYVFARAGIEVEDGVAVIGHNRVHDARTGIAVVRPVSAQVDSNVVDTCLDACIDVIGGGRVAVIRGNQVSGDVTRRPHTGIHANWPVSSGTLAIERNSILGAGDPSDPQDPATYAIARGIEVISRSQGQTVPGAPVAVSANLIRNAQTGISAFQGGSIVGSDNVAEVVFIGLNAGESGSLNIQRSDILYVVSAINGDGTVRVHATCNWWGFAGGPQRWSSAVDPSSFTPWATAPIANGAGGACNGGP